MCEDSTCVQRQSKSNIQKLLFLSIYRGTDEGQKSTSDHTDIGPTTFLVVDDDVDHQLDDVVVLTDASSTFCVTHTRRREKQMD